MCQLAEPSFPRAKSPSLEPNAQTVTLAPTQGIYLEQTSRQQDHPETHCLNCLVTVNPAQFSFTSNLRLINFSLGYFGEAEPSPSLH